MPIELPDVEEQEPAQDPQKSKSAAPVAAPYVEPEDPGQDPQETAATTTKPAEGAGMFGGSVKRSPLADPPAIQFTNAEPPANYDEMLDRMFAARAKSTMTTRYDTRGRVRRAGLTTEDEAMVEAANYLPKFLESPNGPQLVRDFIAGGKVPDGWVLRTDPIKALEDQELEWRAQAGRESDPIRAAIKDWLVDPLGNILPAVGQVFADTYAGLANFIPGVDIKPWDVKTEIHTLGGLLGDQEQKKQEMAAVYNTANDWAKALQKGGEFVGTAVGMFAGGGAGAVGRTAAVANTTLKVGGALARGTFGAGGKLGALAGGAVAGKYGAAFGRSIGSFGAYETLVARGEGDTAPTLADRLEGGAWGAAAGAVIHGGAILGKFAYANMLKGAYKSLGDTEKEAIDVLRLWGEKNNVFRRAGQSDEGFVKELVGKYGDAGFPGAPKMPVRRMVAHATQAGMESAGMSSLDAEFRADLYDGLFNGNAEALKRAEIKFVGTMFGLAALHIPLRDIPMWQRRSQVEPQGERELLRLTFQVPSEPAVDITPMGGAPEAGITKMEGEADLLGPQAKAPAIDKATGIKLSGPAPLVRLGWRNVFPTEPTAPEQERPTPVASGQAVDPATLQLEAERQAAINMATGTEVGGGSAAPAGLRAKPSPTGQFVDPATLQIEAARRVALNKATGTEFGAGEPAVAGLRKTFPSPQTAPQEVDPATLQARPPKLAEQPSVYSVELPGTELSYSVSGGVATPSPALAKQLGRSEPLPVAEMETALEQTSLISALRSKTIQGTEISSDGIVAVPTDGETPGEMRTVRVGQIMVSPLGPVPEWTNVDEAPSKAKGVLEPDQQQVVATLTDALNQRQDIDDPTKSILSHAREVLDTVPAANDQSVAETVAAIEPLLPVIVGGEPAEASAAIKAVGEMLTTKLPEDAIADMDLYKIREGYSSDPTKNAAVSIALDDIFTIRDEIDRLQAAGDAATADRYETLLRDEANNARDLNDIAKQIKRDGSREGESGSADPLGIATAVAERGVEILGSGIKGAASLVRKGWDFHQRSQIQRVADLGMPVIASKIGRKGTTNTKLFRTQLDNAGLIELRRSGSLAHSMDDVIGDGIGGYTTTFALHNDEGMQRHWGQPRALTPGEQRVFDLTHSVFIEAGKIAEGRGTTFVDSGKKFTVDPNRLRHIRMPTPEWHEASLQGKGNPLYDRVMRWLADAMNWTEQEARDRYTESRSLIKLDPTETSRKIDFLPIFVDGVQGRSGMVRLYESDPLKHTERMAFNNSQVMGVRSVLPRVAPTPKGKAEKQAQWSTPIGLEPLPMDAQQVVDKVLTEKGQTAADAVARMLYVMHGMAAHRDPGIFRPGETGYDVGRVFGALFGVAKGAALSLSATTNIFEPVTSIPFFGLPATVRSYNHSLAALATGQFADLHRQMVSEGFLADTKLNDPWVGDEPVSIETFEKVLRKATEMSLTLPLRATQDLNEIIKALNAKQRLAAMQAGEGSKADENALKQLKLDDATIAAMLAGNGTQADYDNYRTNIVGHLSGGKSQVGAEKSDAAHSRGHNALVWFTNFFQGMSRIFDTMLRDLAAATGPSEKAEQFRQILKFAGATVIGGAGGTLLQKLLGGVDDMVNYMRESISGATAGEQATNIGKSIIGAFANGVVGGTGGSLAQLPAVAFEKGDSIEKLGEAAVRVFGPVGAAGRFFSFVKAAIDIDTPGYENMGHGAAGLLPKLGKYLRNSAPAARVIHEGLFGISALAITNKDPKLDAAQDSYYRWRRTHKPLPDGSDTEERNIASRDAMREVVDHVMAGESWSDQELVDAIVSAEAAKMTSILTLKEGSPKVSASDAYKQARSRVASSLRQRKILPDPKSKEFTADEEKSLYAHLGDKNIEILRAFDLTLEALAKRVSHGSLRSQVDAVRGSDNAK